MCCPSWCWDNRDLRSWRDTHKHTTARLPVGRILSGDRRPPEDQGITLDAMRDIIQCIVDLRERCSYRTDVPRPCTLQIAQVRRGEQTCTTRRRAGPSYERRVNGE